MSRVSEGLASALYLSDVARPGQLPLFTAVTAEPAQIEVVLCRTPESFLVLMEAELARTKAWHKEQTRLCNLRHVADSYVPEQLLVLPPAADEPAY